MTKKDVFDRIMAAKEDAIRAGRRLEALDITADEMRALYPPVEDEDKFLDMIDAANDRKLRAMGLTLCMSNDEWIDALRTTLWRMPR